MCSEKSYNIFELWMMPEEFSLQPLPKKEDEKTTWTCNEWKKFLIEDYILIQKKKMRQRKKLL